MAVIQIHVAGIRMKSHDFAFRVDRLDLGLLDIAVPVGHVNRREDAIDQATVASDCHGLRTAPLLAPSGMRPTSIKNLTTIV